MISPLPGATTTKPGSATFPLPGIGAELLDDDGKHVEHGGGYLTLTHPWPGMLRGIWKDPERYKDAYWSRFEGRYFAGDGAKLDDDGYLWLLGRVDDVMNVSGHRISTTEVESALVSHPSVAEAAVVGANDAYGRQVFGNLINNDVVNMTGPDRCGEGYFRNAGNITQNNGASIVLNKAHLQLNNPTNFASTGGGFIDVKDGSTLKADGVSIPANHTLKLAGCGKCNDIGTQDGALLVGTNGTNIASPIILQSEVCIDHTGTGNVVFSGQISGDHKIKLNNQADSTTRQGGFSFTSTTAPFFDNTLEATNVGIGGFSSNAMSKADIVMLGSTQFQQDGGAVNLGSLSSPDRTTNILANSSVSITLKENGDTTYAGNFANSTPGTPWIFRIDGPSTNVIRLTNPTTTAVVGLRSTNGGRIVFEGTQMNSYSATGGGTISAGKKRTARIDVVTLTANDAVDVYASGTTTGMLWSPNGLSVAAGWKVNLMEPLPAGTHQIYNQAVTPLPTLGTNLSGRTVTGFANIGGFLTVTLA
jgi:hypothetical protein